MKNRANEDTIASHILAVEPVISDAMRRGIKCHFRIGETLNAIRGQLLLIRGTASESLASFIPPVNIGVPEPGGPYTVETQDAVRLFYQIYFTVYPFNKKPADSPSGS
jgi:hypothetical protein